MITYDDDDSGGNQDDRFGKVGQASPGCRDKG